ncbi:hypothetical protein SNOG_09167 [Parastagonospora nodorum SN15]|uniref:Uncharacterized protein n=1 Tax=Phaeosphaeria nodorum (strain SN15 / ATCC MYA-4574 / FGSC 10173) TaxID=321614 RepID=Q0UGE7_PHANO|nr:hypothetical protein SNOG_09167 [Parastagonospora nodorum SN15]EAT83359.1 hypothetical protein SNOG_09167 [Parastagonospora nodorum SN15]
MTDPACVGQAKSFVSNGATATNGRFRAKIHDGNFLCGTVAYVPERKTIV